MADKEQCEKTPAQNATCDSALHNWMDEELMRELQSGNRDAFSIIFNRYHRLVFVTALRIVQDLGEAEDVMQVVFFEIFQKAVQFDPAKGNLCNWILQYAYHRSIDRKSYLTLRQFYNHIELEAAGGEDIWITRVILPPQEASRLVSESLALLNGQQREVMELVFFRELTLREVAEETKQSVGSVRHHYYRGLKRLRSHFSAASNGNERPAIAPCEKGVRANA